MPSSILPQNHDEQELYNAISSFFHFFINFISEIFFVSAMRRKKKAFLLYRYSNISCAMYSPTEACICSRKQALTKKHFQKILFIAL